MSNEIFDIPPRDAIALVDARKIVREYQGLHDADSDHRTAVERYKRAWARAAIDNIHATTPGGFHAPLSMGNYLQGATYAVIAIATAITIWYLSRT